MQRLAIVSLCAVVAAGILWLIVEGDGSGLLGSGERAGAPSSGQQPGRGDSRGGADADSRRSDPNRGGAGGSLAARAAAGSEGASTDASADGRGPGDGAQRSDSNGGDDPRRQVPRSGEGGAFGSGAEASDSSAEAEAEAAGEGADAPDDSDAAGGPSLADLEAQAAQLAVENGLVDEVWLEQRVTDRLPSGLPPDQRERAREDLIQTLEADEAIKEVLLRDKYGPDPTPAERARGLAVGGTLVPSQPPEWRKEMLEQVPKVLGPRDSNSKSPSGTSAGM